MSLTSLLNRRAELFDAARPTAVSVDKGARQVMDTVGEIFLNTGNYCATVERPQPKFSKTTPFRFRQQYQ